jgi:hypothetical protein
MTNLASIILRISNLRFPGIGSIYLPTIHSQQPTITKAIPISTPNQDSHDNSYSFNVSYILGPIISWPFFGSSRGLQSSLNRGPWRSTDSYLESCAQREVEDVIRENEGRVKGKKPMRMPSSGRSVEVNDSPGEREVGTDLFRYQSLGGSPSPSSSTSSLELEDPADTFYRDYRASQRSSYLVALTNSREVSVRDEMEVALGAFAKLLEELEKANTGTAAQQFGLDLHDLSRDNIFVDEDDHSKVYTYFIP